MSLKDKVDFIRRFYDTASTPFKEIQEKIVRHEAPFDVYHTDYEIDQEPPFQMEWEEADECLNIIGKSCLCLVQDAFRSYLADLVPSEKLRSQKGNWFEKYRNYFDQEYGIDWAASPVDLEILEQLTFARNDIQHRGVFYNWSHRQSDGHFERFPTSIFADEFERETAWGVPPRIVVTRDNLFAAIEAIESFGSYLEAEVRRRALS